LVALRPGDLIMTGTPKGVGRVEPGDQREGHIDGVAATPGQRGLAAMT
jgi:fumarylpyruvate hydrolase